MKNLILLVSLMAFAAPAMAQTYVKGYTRSNGTYVSPHYRSAPDNSRSNNYSSSGNVNPYTGKVGTQNPYSTPSTSSYGYTAPAPSSSYNPYESSDGDE